MAYVGQVIDIFVSSPGDVAEYRDSILSIVQAWNQRNGRAKGLFFNCLRWEDLVAPEMAESGQDVINNQVGEDYDIFLGVMWARFGTPTVSAESGTEEEFDRAVRRHQSGEPIKVSFLFCTADVPMAHLDGVQYAKVQEFKRRAQGDGCLTRDFVDEASLINSINLILDRFANTWEASSKPTINAGSESVQPVGANGTRGRKSGEQIENAEGGAEESAIDDDELGILDVLEDFTEHNSAFVSSFEEWGSRLNSVQRETEIATAKLSELSKFGRPSSDQVRPVLNSLTKEMEEFGNWCEEKLVSLEQIMERISRDSLLLIDVSRDFDEPIEDIASARSSMVELYESIGEANESILGFATSVEQTPKLDKKLNKANKKVVVTHRRLAEKNRLFQDDIALCISDLTERLDQGR